MKGRLILVLVGLILNVNNITSQSAISETNKWAVTCKIWGFLKYYHPQAASGELDWDEQLLKLIPKVRNTQSQEDLSRLFIKWIDELGPVKKVRNNKCKRVEYFEKNFNLSWIDSNLCINNELSEKLRFIEANRYSGKHFYVTSSEYGARNAQFTNELEYENFNWKKPEMRLLSLFRYWNQVEYFFPYKYQTDIDWDDILISSIPKFVNTSSEVEFHLAMLRLIVNLDDSHGSFGTALTYEYFGNYFVPATFRIVEDKAIVIGFWNDSIGALNNLELGDVISKVNGEEVFSIFKKKEKFINGSNIARKKKNAFRMILNGCSDSVVVEITRRGKTFSQVIRRYRFQTFNYTYHPETEKYRILDDNIGYINLGSTYVTDVDSIMEVLRNTKAIIIDIRNGARGTGPSILNYTSSKSRQFYKVTEPDLSYPGKFILDDGRKVGGKAKYTYEGKVILLVDEKVQSHGEFTTMCLQTGDQVTTIGSQTSGADGNVSKIVMVGGYKTVISGIGIFYPDGAETQRLGVKIDIPIEYTVRGFVDGRDEILEKAIEFIKE